MKKISVLLILIMCLTTSLQINIFAVDDGNNPGIITQPQEPAPPTQPSLIMVEPSSLIIMNAGETKNVSFALKNIGTSAATNLSIIPQATSNVFIRISDISPITRINAGETKRISMTISIPYDAPADTNTATINFNYRGTSDKTQYDGTGSFLVKVNNEKEKQQTNLILKNIHANQDVIMPEDTFKLISTIQSTTPIHARNVQVILEGLNQDTFVLNNSVSSIYLENFDGNASEDIFFDISVAKKVKAGSYPITLNLKYKDKDGKDYSDNYTYYVGISEKTKQSPNEDRAYVSFSDVVTPIDSCDVGEIFTIAFDVSNSGNNTASNLKLIATNDDEKSIVPKSSNVIQIPQLLAGETKTVRFSFSATSTAISQNYSIGFKAEYENGAIKEDDNGNETKEFGEFEQYVGVNIINSKIDNKQAKEEIKEQEKDEYEREQREVERQQRIYEQQERAYTQQQREYEQQQRVYEQKQREFEQQLKEEQVIYDREERTYTQQQREYEQQQRVYEQKQREFEQQLKEEQVIYDREQRTYEQQQKDYEKAQRERELLREAEREKRELEREEREYQESLKDDGSKNIPKIIVSNYTVEPLMVMAGTEFDLTMDFKNTHSEKIVKNIKATLTVPPADTSQTPTTEVSSGNVFSPIDASNTFYVDKIATQGISQQNIRLYCVPDASPKNYVLLIKFEYEDGEGNPIEGEEQIGINVRQNSKLEIGEINMPPTVNVGEPIYVDFQIQNTGKVTLNNLKFKLVGDAFDTIGSEIIYGNFKTGDHDYYTASFVPLKEGLHNIEIYYSYDDDSGERLEKSELFALQVNEATDMYMIEDGMLSPMSMVEFDEEGNPFMMDAEGNPFSIVFDDMGGLTYKNGKPIEFDEFNMPIAPTSGFSWKILAIITTVIIAVGGVVFFVYNKKKKDMEGFNE